MMILFYFLPNGDVELMYNYDFYFMILTLVLFLF
jgi:hypothetical protein